MKNLKEIYNPREKYILLQWGTGDTINNLVAFFYYYSTDEWCLIAPKSQEELILFVCKLHRKSFKQYIWINLSHQGSLNNWLKSQTHITSFRGFPTKNPGEICDLWLDPKLLPRKYPIPQKTLNMTIDLFKNDVTSQINSWDVGPRKILAAKHPLIFFPGTSKKNASFDENFWNFVGNYVNTIRGVTTFTNLTDKQEYQEFLLPGTLPARLTYEQLASLAVAHPRIRFVMSRSGITDFLRFFGGKALVFYPMKPNWYWGKSRMHHIMYSKFRETEILLDPAYPINHDFLHSVFVDFMDAI